jgi:hypothetical protein
MLLSCDMVHLPNVCDFRAGHFTQRTLKKVLVGFTLKASLDFSREVTPPDKS